MNSRHSSLPARLGLAASALVLTLAATGLANAQSLDIAIQENPLVLDPILIQNNIAYRVLPNVFDTLIMVDYQDGQKLKPSLATEWTLVDPRTLELKLRQDVKFQDGTDFSAEDVVFSLGPDRMAEGKPGYSTFVGFLSTIEKVEAVDDYTVRITTTAPDPIIELRLSGWGSQIVSKDAFDAVGGDWDRWSAHPVGSGPFEIAEFVPGEKLVLHAFEDYWGNKPNLQEVNFLDVPEMSTRVAGLFAGDYDIIGEITPDQIDGIEANPGFGVVGGTIRNHRTVVFDMDNLLIQDVRIRKALSLAIDRQLLVDTIWGGRVEVTNGLQWPEFGALYNPDRKGPVYDPVEAKRLLDEAGYKGEVIPFRIRSNYYPAEIVESEAMVAMWQAVGFNIDLQIKESWDQVYAEPGTGIRSASAPPLFADPISGIWRNYGKTGTDLGPDAWKNDEFNALGQILIGSTDVAARAEAHQKMLDIWHDIDPPGMMLHAMGQFYGIRDGVTWTPYNAAFMDLGGNNLSVTQD